MNKSIGLIVIVKDEVDLIDKFLSYNMLSDIFQEIRILDGFSTDGTWDKLVEYQKQGICTVSQRELNFDFAAQRNYVSSLMKSPYILRLDVDERMSFKLQDWVNKFAGGSDYYMVNRDERINGKHTTYTWTPFLYKNQPEIKWVNRIHEMIAGYKTMDRIPEEYFLLHDKTSERQDRQSKFYSDNWEEQRIIIGMST